jgi:hypothetical protein
VIVASSDKLSDELINAYAHVSAANQRTLDRLAVVLDRFHSNGIDCLLLKGADLLSRLYGIRGLRPLADVDLLVREQDLPAIDRVLTGMGYKPAIDGNPAYVAPDDSLILDLITDIWYAGDTEAIWQRAAERTTAGRPAKGMGSDDLLIYLVAYCVLNRGYFQPAFSRDIALLVGKEPLNWEFIVDEAVRCNLKIALHHGLSHAVRQDAVPIPEGVLARLAPSTKSEKALAFLFRKLVAQTPLDGVGHLLLLLTQPGAKKWRRLRQAFWPEQAFLKYRYGERGETCPVRTRLARTVNLTLQAHRLLGKILYRLATQRGIPR